MKEIKIHDYGFVQLVDYMGTDLSVVNAARVSFNKSHSFMEESDAKLLRYLASHHHWTPFAHPQLSLRIKGTISIQRQFFKHKIGVVENSESTRYVNIEPEFYIPKHLRLQSKDKKQGSDGYMLDQVLQDELIEEMHDMLLNSFALYRDLLAEGVANELARDVLPLATYTTWISTMSLYAAFNLWKLRTHDGAQEEIGEYAKAIEKIVEPLFPQSWKALKETSNQ